MRILLVSLWHVEYALELADALSRKDHEIKILLIEERVKETVGENSLKNFKFKLRYTLIPFKSFKHPYIIGIILKIFSIVFSFKPHVIHIQECYNPLNTVFHVFQSCTVITTIHDIIVHPGGDRQVIQRWKLFVTHLNRRYAYKNIIVHGRALKLLYQKTYKKKDYNIYVIPHGCLSSFKEGIDYKVDEEPYTVLFFGRMNEYKGLRILIEAEPLVSNEYHDFKIIIAGKGEELKKYSSTIKSNSHYEIHAKFIPNKCVAQFFQRASIVVLPYIEASQSGIVAMAFAFGKPVIVTNVGSLSEIVRNGQNGIVIPPNSAPALAQAIKELFKDVSKRKKLGHNAHVISHNELGWDRISRMTIETYNKIKDKKYEKSKRHLSV